MKSFEIRQQIEQINDPEILKNTLSILFDKIDSLEKRLSSINTKNENITNIILDKKERLNKIRHGLTELTERMQKPYIVSAELETVKEVLDVLSEAGECNSVILEGEPGTGKTQWAYSEVGQELQEGKDTLLVHIRIKDTMHAQDLLYNIDDVRRLSDAQSQAQLPVEIRQEASNWKQKIITGEIDPSKNDEYKVFKEKMKAITNLEEVTKDLNYLNYVDLGPLSEAIYQSGKGKKVYLIIDEIEKGREELMTGILDEIENLTFVIGETGTVVKGDKKNLRIVITTNTEDSDKIPPSFRRRSLYYYINYPDPIEMKQIVELNFPNIQKELLDYAISIFYQYHKNEEIEKKPSTPELLAWIRVLSKNFNGSIPDNIPYKTVLLKYQEDIDLDIGKINLETEEEINQPMEQFPYFAQRALRGDQVYHFTDKVNRVYEQDEYSQFYAKLQNKGINFATPVFVEEYDNNDDEYILVTQKEFQVIAPGIEYLGDGYYVIPDDKLSLFEEIIDTKTKVLPVGQKFLSITRKHGDIIVGKIKIDNDEYDAFMNNNGEVVINIPYDYHKI